jgi:hypothetical protein
MTNDEARMTNGASHHSTFVIRASSFLGLVIGPWDLVIRPRSIVVWRHPTRVI